MEMSRQSSVIPKSEGYDPFSRFMGVNATLDREGKCVWRVEKTHNHTQRLLKVNLPDKQIFEK